MKKALFFLTVLALILFGCGKKAMIRKYYVLEITSPALNASLDSLHALSCPVSMGNIEVARAYNQPRIALRTASHELNYYFYHNWAVRPSSAISDLMYQIIKNSGICPHIHRRPMDHSDYRITGHIHQIERRDTDSGPAAHISGSFELIHNQTESACLIYRFNRKTRLTGSRSMNAFANAISRMLFEETLAFTKQLHKKLSDDLKSSEECPQ